MLASCRVSHQPLAEHQCQHQEDGRQFVPVKWIQRTENDSQQHRKPKFLIVLKNGRGKANITAAHKMTLPVVSVFRAAVFLQALRSVVRPWQVDITRMHARTKYKTSHPSINPLFYQNQSIGTTQNEHNHKSLVSESQDQYSLTSQYKTAGFQSS